MLESVEQHWTPPAPLGYSSLRPVRLTRHGIAMIVATAAQIVGAVVLAVFLSGVARREAREERLLRTEGVAAEATLTRLWIASDKEHQPWIAYRFEYAGHIYTQRVKTPKKIWPDLSKGAPIGVRFVPSRPSISHPTAWRAQTVPLWLPFLIAGAMTASSLLLLIPVRRQFRLLGEGRPAPGRVTGFKKRDKTIQVRYEFRLLSGATAQGKSNVSKPPADGAPLCVLYDPENPRRNALYPLSLVRLENAPSRTR